MNKSEGLRKALETLRDADAGRGAPDFLETRLRAAFREKHALRPRFRWSWMGAFVMAAMAVFVMWRLTAPTAVQAPPQIAKKTPPVLKEPANAPEQVAAMQVPKQQTAPAPRRRVGPAPRQAVDAVTASMRDNPFIALPYAPPLAPTDRGQVMRVRMPRQTLRQLGLPMNEERIFERIPADVLLGEDGIPRAIRIVTPR
jgi:hypothetical protein